MKLSNAESASSSSFGSPSAFMYAEAPSEFRREVELCREVLVRAVTILYFRLCDCMLNSLTEETSQSSEGSGVFVLTTNSERRKEEFLSPGGLQLGGFAEILETECEDLRESLEVVLFPDVVAAASTAEHART